ncbi:hypothetical protein BJX61DRAFT_485784 [Aspergillus egyptiacus]|nr:hypothetical protein BJX61DRAFT_485784 [Aspergillus egyptiacus]
MQPPSKRPRRANITIIHPDLGIGGAERLIIDVALALQATGHKVTIYTSHRDKAHCFEEARDGTLDVRVRGNSIFPAHVAGRFHVLMAILRQVHLTVELLGEGVTSGLRNAHTMGDKDEDRNRDMDAGEAEAEADEVFIVDQVPACVPLLRIFGPRWRKGKGRGKGKGRQRILFYCHFPDQLLARRDGGGILGILKGMYRVPFDWFEGWAIGGADRVVANSKFTRGVVWRVFGRERMGDVRVVYPCVDTDGTKAGFKAKAEIGDGVVEKDEGRLWGGKKKILLSVNRFERKKDLALAIRAYHGLGERKRGVRLVIAGSFTCSGLRLAQTDKMAGGYDPRVQENVQYHKELESLAASLGLETATSRTVPSALSVPDSIDVLFLPSVSSAFRDTLLAQSSLLLYTPVNEHFGIVPIEAMRAGIPVLASNTGGPRETIVEGETGWLRDAEDPAQWTEVMEKVLYRMDEKEVGRMAKVAKERVEREFSLRAMGEKLEEEIGEMLIAKRSVFYGVWQVVLALGVLGIVLAVLGAMGLKRFGIFKL